MREIKFKAWEKNFKQIIPVYDINISDKIINTKSAWRLFSEVELMQCTGLKDHKRTDEYPAGQEIFERDILHIEIKDFNTGQVIVVQDCEVIFKGDRFGVKFGNASEFTGLCDFSNNVTFEVIGNVYENSELLEG